MERSIKLVAVLATLAALNACGSSKGSSSGMPNTSSGGNASNGGSSAEGPADGDAGDASNGDPGTPNSGGSGPSGGTGNSATSSDPPAPPSDGMSPTKDTGVPSLFGVWQIPFNNGATIVELILESNGTYHITARTLTSTVTADQTLENGTFVIGDSTLSFTPTERTCTDALTPTTDGYVFDDTYLTLVTATGNVVWTRATALSSKGLTLVTGCGTPFAPVAMQGHEPKPANPGNSPPLFGVWQATDAQGISYQVILKDDHGYRISILIPTSTVTANEYVQEGTFLISGAYLVFTPTKATCPVKAPPFVDGYAFNSIAFVTKDASDTVGVFAKVASDTLGNGLTLVKGCSINNGPWTPAALAAVPK